jgi:hypothetical protein
MVFILSQKPTLTIGTKTVKYFTYFSWYYVKKITMNNFPYYRETFHCSTGNLKGQNISWYYGKLFTYNHETFHGSKMLLGQCNSLLQKYIIYFGTQDSYQQMSRLYRSKEKKFCSPPVMRTVQGCRQRTESRSACL